ncbi:hypothetical protein GCM10009128_06050 [Psychrosphaera haliotis]|uniref:hypothetical protein n=1 Tax=Psychrosphaera haliotis TaxID=555083 RepID=UPI0031D806C3
MSKVWKRGELFSDYHVKRDIESQQDSKLKELALEMVAYISELERKVSELKTSNSSAENRVEWEKEKIEEAQGKLESKIEDLDKSNRLIKAKHDKLEKELEAKKKELSQTKAKLGRPKDKSPKYDKDGLLKVKHTNKRYKSPCNAVINLPNNVDVKLASVVNPKRLNDLIKAANCGVRTDKRAIHLKEQYNYCLLNLFREMEPRDRKALYHHKLGALKLGSEIYNYVSDYRARKGLI